jgi:hypothetical protein
MSRRLSVLLAAAVAAFGCAGVAAAYDSPAPLSPDDASALIAAPGAGAVSAPSAVDATTVLAATSLPGADTSIESDLTLDQAVGLAPSPDSTTPSTDSTTTSTDSTTTSTDTALAPLGMRLFSLRPMCWADQGWWGWGTWPYEQKITDTTYWCAVYGSRITLRTSSVTAGGTLCAVNWRSSQLIGGGVGFPTFTMRSSAGFSCPTVIPWITLHPTHHLDILRTDRGAASITGAG